MDFTFTDQQVQFRDAVRSFLVVEAAPELLREYWETASGRSQEMRRKVTEQGLTGLSVPEKFGGMGLGDLDWVLLLEEIGYHGIPDSLSDSAYLGVGMLNALPDDSEFKAQWLERMVEGKARMAIGHPVNPLVHDAEIADLMLLWHEDEIHALSQDQVEVELNPSIDQSRRPYAVRWEPGEATRMFSADVGAGVWADTINRASVSVASQLLGLARRMMDLGIDYAAQRKQFGKPIGSFQAVKHHMADIAVKIEFAGPVVHRAAYALHHDDPRIDAFASHAKLAAAEAALLAARNSMQVHGAMGYTWEADLQMFMKRAWALESYWGDRIFHKSRLAQSVFADGAALGPGSTF